MADATVMTTTASDVKLPLDEDPTGVPPNHKDSEPMYPTVVDIPLSEPSNTNGPTSEKIGSENVLPKEVKATLPVAAVAHTAPVATVPLMTTTASDVKFPVEERTGLAPDHKDSESMYPTVVDIPFVEANNANGPSSAKLGNEDRLPVTVNTVKIDKVVSTGDKVTVTEVTTTPSINDVIIAANEKNTVTKGADVVSAPSINDVIIAANEKNAVVTAPSINDVIIAANEKKDEKVNSINAVIEAANAIPVKSSASSSSSSNKMMSSSKPLMTSSKSEKASTMYSGLPKKSGGSPSKSPSSGLHKPTWKPSSKPIEKKDLIKVDFSYGSFQSDDFMEPMPQTDILVVKQIVDGVGKRAGDWKEHFEAAFIPATAKVLGISKHGIQITSVDRTDPQDENGNRDKKIWQLQITYIVYDTACVTDATDDDDSTFGPDDTVDDDGIEPLPTSSKKSSKSSKSSSKNNKDRFLTNKKNSKSVKKQPLPDSCALKASTIQKQLSDKQNQKAINLAMEDAEIGKGTTHLLHATCNTPLRTFVDNSHLHQILS